MDTSAFPDWRRIGHRIGKRLKDVLDPQPTNPGPSPEECKAQRIRDSFKGLVYFDNFAEVEAWSESDIDPIQQANQPLLFRHSSQVHDDIGSKTKLTLCHDYKGGYHDYESVRPDPLSTELYSCKYLQFVDTFIYFSHKLVCVPPPSWSNVLHRNGSKVLGTFLIEPQTDDVERLMLKRNGKYLLATRLAEMATGYGFDGWLLNVEKDAPEDYPRWSQELTAFILELRGNLGEDKAVIWYDALTVEGDVYYQNGLTPSNRLYAMAADGIFTNYKWTDKHLASTKASATAAGMSTSKIFFGIDVWAQNTNMPGPPRVTYPAEGGGGTNTGLVCSLALS